MSDERDICQCPTCGRLHRQLSHTSPPVGLSQLKTPVPVPLQWHHIRFGNPVPTGDDYVMLSTGDYRRALHDRDFQELAIRDAIAETARIADELAFWRYQAIYIRAYLHESTIESSREPETTDGWKRAERELEALQRDENRERTAHAEAPRDPGAT